jgi:GTP-binding protein EngB required for normal cell division
MHTPATLKELHRFIVSLDWEDMMSQVEQETHARLAIVGPVNAGKSTLFNTLLGRDVSPISPVPGTTQELVTDWFGPFVLVDTPGFGEAGSSFWSIRPALAKPRAPPGQRTLRIGRRSPCKR